LVASSTHHPLLINLSFLGLQPTGLTTYASNLVSACPFPNATLLAAAGKLSLSHSLSHYRHYDIPGDLSSDYGTRGHMRRLLWTQFQLPKLYRRLNASLLFSPVPEAPLGMDCSYMVMVHDLIPLHFKQWKSPLKYYFRYYVPQVLHQARHIICNSQATADDVVNFYQVPAAKITPILLAHDPQNFRFLDLPKQNYFIYVGRCDPYKNLERALNAFARLASGHDYEFWIVGPPDKRYTPHLQFQAEQLNIAHQVKFLDYVAYDQLPILLNQAIALVFPSLWEGFGLPVLEAMACGTPVITSNLASLPEVTGNAALLVNPYDETAICQAMRQMITDNSLRSHLQTAGLTRAKQFSWIKTAQRTIEVLGALIK